MRIRELNAEGTRQFKEYLESLAEFSNTPIPLYLLTDPDYSVELEFEVALDDREFNSRYDMASYLVDRMRAVNLQDYLGNSGFWTWLGLYWFNQLCPADGAGSRTPSKPYNYILSNNFKHQPRHAIRTSYLLVKNYGEDARFLLCNPMQTRGDLTEQMSTRQFFIECDGVVRAASALYFDKSKDWYKTGAASYKRKGNIRRLISFLRQIELTYDLYSIHHEDLIGMLPGEFDAFRKSS